MKRALSPLISTILLIVVALALVSILLSWGTHFAQKNTSDVDNTIDNSCIGIGINVISCDYNSVGNKLVFTIINNGSVNFNSNNKFSAVLIDNANKFDNNYPNILNSESLNKGESKQITISNYTGETPIFLKISNTQCAGYSWNAYCK